MVLCGFPDNLHLYDRLVPHLSGRKVVVFDFLGWGGSDKPEGYPVHCGQPDPRPRRGHRAPGAR